MTDADIAISLFRRFVEENPYTGTTEQVATLAMGIAAAGKRLPRPTFSLYRDESGIGEKVFSKLKVIGNTLGELKETKRREVIKGLPASYSAIHLLCTLKSEDLANAVLKGHITPNSSVRAIGEYVKQVRYPQQAAKDGEKGRWGKKEETVFRIARPADTPLGDGQQELLETELRKVCRRFGVSIRKETPSTTSLEAEDRRQRALFWWKVMEEELSQDWLQAIKWETRKRYEVTTVDALWNAPLRTFQTFMYVAGKMYRVKKGNKKVFAGPGAKGYIAKLQYLQEVTSSRSQRYNYKRRVDELLGKEEWGEITIWRNVLLKSNGFI